jgi:hypothetical protein
MVGEVIARIADGLCVNPSKAELSKRRLSQWENLLHKHIRINESIATAHYVRIGEI